MDKLSIAIFFLFFAFSFARTPLTQQEFDITNIKLPESDATTTTTATTNEFDKETRHVQENQDHLPESRDKKFKVLPLTFVRLHPINRHFRARSRRPSRLCDHHHHFHHADNLKPRTQSTHLDDQIPYVNDMIRSDDDNDDFEDVFPGGLHQVPEDWMSFLHHNNEDDDDDDDEAQKMSKFIIKRNNHDKFGKMKLKGHLYDPFEEEEHEDEDRKISAMQHEDHRSFDKKKMKKHLHHHHEEEEQEAVEGNEAHKEEKKTSGFVRHIRKFLDNYFD